MTEFLLYTWLSLSASDAVTTHMVLNRGAIELNPIANTPVKIYVTKSISGGLGTWYIKTQDEKHPKLIKLVNYIAIGTYGYATVNNIIVYKRLERK